MFSRILVAVDGSPAAEKALESAIELAKKCSAELTILHVILQRLYTVPPSEAGVVSPTVFVSEMQTEGENILRKAEEQATGRGINYQCKIMQGVPADEIVKFANSQAVDLVITGSRGLNEVRGFLFGSVSDKVCHHVKCPTLIIK